MKLIIDKIPPGHELYPYREKLMEEIPDFEDLRQSGAYSRGKIDKKCNIELFFKKIFEKKPILEKSWRVWKLVCEISIIYPRSP